MIVTDAFIKFLCAKRYEEDGTWEADAEATMTLIDFILENATDEQKKNLIERLMDKKQ